MAFIPGVMRKASEVNWEDDWAAATWLAERDGTCLGVYEREAPNGERQRCIGRWPQDSVLGELVMRTEHHGLWDVHERERPL